jgi:hypothetical protein
VLHENRSALPLADHLSQEGDERRLGDLASVGLTPSVVRFPPASFSLLARRRIADVCGS